MAKGARASTRKRNGAALREKVFNPVYDARLDRLSAKLQAIADTPKPESDKEVIEEKLTAEDDAQAEEMQWTAVTSARKAKQQKTASRAGRVAKRRAKNQVVFPSEIARKKRQQERQKKNQA